MLTTQPAPTEGTLRTADGHALPLRHTEVRGRLDGPVADVAVVQHFENDRSVAIEAVYAFPLPAGASVYRLELRFAGRVVRAVVKEKEAAARAYREARAEGRAATLLEQDASEVFTLAVANIPPGEAIEVELRYQELLAHDDGEWRFAFPMVARERYLERPALRAHRADADQVLGAAHLPAMAEVRPPRVPSGERGPDVRLTLDVRAEGSLEALRCASHLVEIEPVGEGRALVRLDARAAIANRDFVLAYRAGGRGVRTALRFERDGDLQGTLLLTLTPSSEAEAPERAGQGAVQALRCGNCGAALTDTKAFEHVPGVGVLMPCGYCHALLAPSTDASPPRAARPRDVTLLIDRSASMRGAMGQVRAATRALLEALPPTDALRVIAFDHDREPFDGGALRGVSAELAGEIDVFLGERAPRGGTELERMLERASELPMREGRTALVVLITDGAVGNEGRLVRRARELLGARRLFVLGCGAAPDRRLCARLARIGGGATEVLAPSEEDAVALARFARRVREAGPVLTGLSITFEGLKVEAHQPRPLPDLFGGEPVQVLARYAAPGAGRVLITGLMADGRPFRQRLPLLLPERGDTPGLERLWAARQIEAWLEESADEPRRAVALREKAVALALATSLVTPLTSLVAEDDRVVSDGEPTRITKGAREAAAAFDDLEEDAEAADEPRHDHARRSHGASPASDGAPTGGASIARGASLGAPPAPMCCPAPAAPPPPAGMAPGRVARERTAPLSMASPPRSPAPFAKGRRLIARAKRLADAVFARDEGGVDEVADLLAPRAAGSAADPRSQPIDPITVDVHYPPRELAWLDGRASGALDLVFLVDETGSMGSYIAEVKARLLALVRALTALPLARSLHLGLVTYRDHPPQDASYASRATPLTSNIAAIERAVAAMTASGGGDGPESVTDGLADVVRMAWRPNAARVVVWFGDAPPHGVEPRGDGFPNGCPCGDHWYTQAESLREMGVAVYAVGCLPALRAYVGAEEVFKTVAATARGLYLPLTEAHLLVPLMAAAAATELDRQRVDEYVAAALERYAELLGAADERERVRWLRDLLHGAGVKPRAMEHREGARRAPAIGARALTEADVEGALARLRLAGRAA